MLDDVEKMNARIRWIYTNTIRKCLHKLLDLNETDFVDKTVRDMEAELKEHGLLPTEDKING